MEFSASNRSAAGTDADLARAAQRGEKRAFVEIVARHQAMVCGIALGILRDFAASEDAAQEAFLTAWRKIHDLQDPERLRGWLGQIARNAALCHLRRERGGESLDELDRDAFADDAPPPDAVAASEDEAALVRNALDKLPENYRLPIILYYREGNSVRVVAEALGISEDAVKQRLARGRDMLRDRVAGVIETVLKKTGPTPVFTMTIAAAIGALASPALVAGTVFSAAAATSMASAATTSSAAAAAAPASTSTTSAIITFMSTTKGLVATAALVTILCIPVGYNLAPGTQATRTEAVSAESEPSTKAFRKAPDFSDSVLFADWRRLHELHGTNGVAMPSIYKEIAGMKDTFRRRAFRAALVAEWVQVDPHGGLRFFIAGKDSAQRRQFFKEWLAIDPRAAVEGLLAQPGWEALARESLVDIAEKVPERVMEIVNELPKDNNYWDTSVRDAVAILADRDLPNTRRAAEAISGPNREQALAGVARAWGKTALNDAITWAKALPVSEGVDQNEIVRAAVYGQATVDPVAALDQVGSVPPGGRSGYFADTMGAKILKEAAATDFDATVKWIVGNPGRLGHEDMMGIAQSVTERLNADATGFLSQHATEGSLEALMPAIGSALLNDGAGQRRAIWDWLKGQPESNATRALRQEVLNSAAFQEPLLALKFAADLPKGTSRQEYDQLASALYNGGSRLYRFENLMEDAPASLRGSLIQTAFGLLSPDTLGDPNTWIARLTDLPEDSRSGGMQSIARAWAGRSPEEALNWVAKQPPGEGRSDALGAVVDIWAQKDPFSTAEWLTSMPAGTERDRSAVSLVRALGERHPQEAWQWALSISDERQRSSALGDVITQLNGRDPGAARQWLEQAPMDAETKTHLLKQLEEPQGGIPIRRKL